MFTSRHVKHSKLLMRHAHKFLHYKEDLLAPADREEVESGMRRLKAALRQGERKEIEARAESLDGLLHRLSPVNWESHWRENVEVILVAIVVAVGVRSYFLQPFKIPTGSMQPTLNGIIGHRAFVGSQAEIPVDQQPGYEKRADGWYWKAYPADGAKPNILRQAVEFFVLGRNYINVVAAQDDMIIQINPKKYGFFFTFSEIVGQKESYLAYAPPDTLRQDFKVLPGAHYKKGDVIARGAVDTGDQVFVDKFSYNFIRPQGGDVFVFRTDNIPGIPGDPETGEHSFYIKRL